MSALSSCQICIANKEDEVTCTHCTRHMHTRLYNLVLHFRAVIETDSVNTILKNVVEESFMMESFLNRTPTALTGLLIIASDSQYSLSHELRPEVCLLQLFFRGNRRYRKAHWHPLTFSTVEQWRTVLGMRNHYKTFRLYLAIVNVTCQTTFNQL